ncbi:MAG: ribonuclease HII [Alistipes putredinis]|nr:MAG: ribonuclease HII [Alistipes putredinis]
MLETCFSKDAIEAGCDEAGRGCLAGPVFAAAVIFAARLLPPAAQRLQTDEPQEPRTAARNNRKKEAVAWAVEQVSAARIDEINILNASFEGMSLAVSRLAVQPQHLLIDGNRFRTTLSIPYKCVVKGDAKYANIAAASVLAKTHRDELMRKLAAEFPEYGWDKNMGYPTRQHRLAIARLGITPHHRVSFHSEAGQMSLFP